MAKDLKVSYLLEYYGDLLTEKQRSMVDMYYNEDLSLAEIAEIESITRQGVRDFLKKAEAQLYEFEATLHLMKKISILNSLAEKSDIAALKDRLTKFTSDWEAL